MKVDILSYYMFKNCGYEDECVLVDENFKNGRCYDVVVMARFEG